MKDYKAAFEKAKKLCYFLDEHLEEDLIPDNWKKRKDLYNELAALEAEIEKEETANGINLIGSIKRDVCNYWMPDKNTSATRCSNCGHDKWEHEL